MQKDALPLRTGVGAIVLTKIMKFLLVKEEIILENIGKCHKVVLVAAKIILMQ